MIKFNCWGCGKLLKANDAAAGKKCKCGCGKENTVPAMEPQGENTDTQLNIPEPISKPEPDPTPEFDFEPQSLPSRKQSSHFVEYKVKEPWYFTAIEYWCYFNLLIAVFVFFVLIIFFAMSLAKNLKIYESVAEAMQVAIIGFIGAAFMLFGYIAVWSVILLALDVARNIRGIRHAAFKLVKNTE